MKKVLLLTWYDNQNYGTSLQASSLSSIIKSPEITGLNYELTDAWDCELLRHRPVRSVSKSRKLLKIFSLKTYKNKWGQLRDKRIIQNKRTQFELRKYAFDRFTTANFKFATVEDCQTIESLTSATNGFDVVMSGSDQVWNPEALDPTYLLLWVPFDKKKVSYGSSLSIREILPEYTEIYKNALKSFSAISIRDIECRQQLSEIAEKPVNTVVDPVILLGGKALKCRKENISLPNAPYVFCYFLGNNSEHRKKAKEFADNNKMPLVSIIHCGSGYSADKELEPFAIWDVNPNQFISCIDNASIVFTDSFHATVISTLLHTEFYVFEKDHQRPEQNTRIKEFLSLANLSERWEPMEINNHPIKNEDWLKSDVEIDVRRQESMDYLMGALSNE